MSARGGPYDLAHDLAAAASRRTRVAAELRLRGELAGVELDERGERFVAWVKRFDTDALEGLAAVVEAVRLNGRRWVGQDPS